MRKFFSLTLAAALILSAQVVMASPYLEGNLDADHFRFISSLIE